MLNLIHGRHVVETASKPLLTFTWEVTTPWEDAASWFCDTVLSNDVPIEAAVNLGIRKYRSAKLSGSEFQ